MSTHPRHPAPAPALLLALVVTFSAFSASAPRRLTAQAVAANTQLPPAPMLSTPTAAIPTSIAATKVESAPAIDGRDDDAIWQNVPRIDGFREARPTEDADPKQRTEFRVAYDPKYLYVFSTRTTTGAPGTSSP
ncbi:MAG: hypothetical protein JF590_06765 [Gemmatimonadetes bacterium]|nr:hypothetical protein [Gemmatimonadota bacterium]